MTDSSGVWHKVMMVPQVDDKVGVKVSVGQELRSSIDGTLFEVFQIALVETGREREYELLIYDSEDKVRDVRHLKMIAPPEDFIEKLRGFYPRKEE